MEPNELNQNVNLRFCTDCGNQYSRQAPACPRCGCPNKARDTGSDDPILWVPTILFPLFFILSKNKARAWTARILVALCVMGSIVGSMVISCALSSAFYGSTADDFVESVRVDCNGVTLEMVKIPNGHFVREDGKTITISRDFWLGTYEVTQEQWQAEMGSNPSFFKGSNRPVENVRWEDAIEFCNKLNERYAGKLPVINGVRYQFDLPTEAQWEYACRAGTTTHYSYGDASDTSKMNFDGDYPYGGGAKGVDRGKTVEVGSLEYKNAFGLYDMHGNVWEWCKDWYGDYTGDATDPVGPSSGSFRVCRGGSWYSGAECCRSAYRFNREPDVRRDNLGFRLALVPVQ